MNKWMILQEESDNNYTIYPPPSKATAAASTLSPTSTKKRNYGCFKYFRKNLPPLLKSLTITTSNDKTGGYTRLSSGLCCSKMLLSSKNGQPQNKVILFAEESWAQSAASTYWVFTPSYWRRNGCNVEEVSGYRKNKGKGEIVYCNGGSLVIAGSFDKFNDIPDFKLSLTTNVGQTEYNMGYSMTGTLERGWSAMNKFETTHYAVVKKHWPESSFSAKAGFKLL